MKLGTEILLLRNIGDIHEAIFHKKNYIPLTASELASARCASIARILTRFGIDSPGVPSVHDPQIKDVLSRHGEDIRRLIPPIWRHRLLTASFMYRRGDIMFFGEGTRAMPFREQFDYNLVSDGGVKVVSEEGLDLETARQMTITKYLAARGGWHVSSGFSESPNLL